MFPLFSVSIRGKLFLIHHGFSRTYTEKSKYPSDHFKLFRSEIKQETDLKTGCLKVVDQLSFILIRYRLYCLVFYQNLISYQEIGSKPPLKYDILILDI